MDEILRRNMEKEYEKRKKEDELFNTMMDNRLKREVNISNMVKHRDENLSDGVEESEEEEVYVITQDLDGEIDVEKKDK